MTMLLRSAARLTLLLAAAALPALAAPPDAEVEALQMPAWLTRDGQRTPLAPGARLRNGDRIDTGAGSRALLRLPDGSLVKLGEKARFSLDGVSGARRTDGLFNATLNVLQGAFRFTTTALYKFRGRRDIEVRFPTVTAGIRGTDLWGKATAEREIVALIEGRITVTRRGTPPLDLDQPRSLYQALRNAGVLPVEQISDEALAVYAAETEIAPGQGAAGKGGKWRVYAARVRTQDEALAVYDRLREAGYPATIHPTQKEGTTVYQVRIGGLLSEADGVAVAIRLKSELGLTDVSVSLI
jgi:hypothetical protein